MSDDKMLERVRSLLAKAERASTDHERDAYNAKAAELIAKYGIDEALAAAERHERPAVGDRVIGMPAPFARDKALLLHAIAVPLGVQTVLTQRPGFDAAVHLFGTESDLDRVEILFTSLLVQAMRELVRQRPTDPGESVAAYRRSWLVGYAAKIKQRLEGVEVEAQQQAQAEHTGMSTELVLADRDQLVRQVMTERYPRLRQGRIRRSGRGAADGAAAGQRADLGTGRHVGAGGMRKGLG